MMPGIGRPSEAKVDHVLTVIVRGHRNGLDDGPTFRRLKGGACLEQHGVPDVTKHVLEDQSRSRVVLRQTMLVDLPQRLVPAAMRFVGDG